MIVRNFVTYSQLIFDTEKQRFSGCELLARPKSGTMDIEKFFTHVNTESLTKWFIKQVRESIQFKQKTGISCHVNVDRRTLEEYLPTVIMSIQDFDPNHSTTVELTQVHGLPDPDLVDHLRKELDFKISFALDDFVFDPAINYDLEKYHFDMIKLDKHVVETAEKEYVIQRRLLDLRETYDVKYVVEGVETYYQAQMLRDLGFHNFQGYFYHKPEPMNNVISKLNSRTDFLFRGE